jgi:hypothetical protein
VPCHQAGQNRICIVDAATKIPSDARSAAKYYISHFDFSPVRVGARSKKPTPGYRAWQDTRLTTDAEVDAHFNIDPACTNVGIIWGHSNVVDVDCDATEVFQLAPHFLPATQMIFGRKSAPNSHWIYRVTDQAKTLQFADPTVVVDKKATKEVREAQKKRAMLLEVRASGHTVFPPSIHNTGELIEFSTLGDPGGVDMTTLEFTVACLASCALLARHWPEVGARHDALLPLIGALARYWNAEQVHRFATDMYRCIGGESPQDEIRRQIAHTYTELEARHPVTGATKLKEFLNPLVVDTIVGWLQISEPKEKKGAQRIKRLFDLVEPFEFFCNDKSEAYVIFNDDGHSECARIDSSRFKGFLATAYYDAYQDLLAPETLKSVLQILATRAAGMEPRDVFVRFGWKDGKTYLDLCDKAWRVVEIDDQGWRILDKSPVPFRRDKAMKPLPEPQAGGSIADLFECVNARRAEDRIGYVSWLLSSFHPYGTLPILSVVGGHGSGKSQSGKTLKRITDDSAVTLETKPREERDLAIAMKNSAIVAYDNLSGIPDWLSDAFCRVSDKAGFRTRALYENDEESLFCERRSIVLSGIVTIAARADLADRTIHVELEAIEDRETERVLEAKFQERWPKILGALLDAVSTGLKHLDTTPADPNIRMADFTQWIMACEPALVGIPLEVQSILGSDDLKATHSWQIGTFREFYLRNRQDAVEQNLDDDPFATALLALVPDDPRVALDLSAQQLLEMLPCPEELRREHIWPVSAKAVGHKMSRVIPSLLAIGIEVTKYRDTAGKKKFSIRRLKPKKPVSPEVSMTAEEYRQFMKEA